MLSWKNIDGAPKNCFVLGISAKTKLPFQMIWNVPEERFIGNWIRVEDEVEPTHFMHLPGIPPKHMDGWLPLDQAPRTGYCLGYDQCLKVPFVMNWHPKKQKFVAAEGMGDEEPELCMLLPDLVDEVFERPAAQQADKELASAL
ncbi:hypothetical protein AB4Y45_34685 [Paraburkholderia sp. EG287A]|uniref:hypothetical protein n=1 Tax=Paraburkholderia sp. EG287A TaxID=3237012 RepID=UPI0034D364FB